LQSWGSVSPSSSNVALQGVKFDTHPALPEWWRRRRDAAGLMPGGVVLLSHRASTCAECGCSGCDGVHMALVPSTGGPNSPMCSNKPFSANAPEYNVYGLVASAPSYRMAYPIAPGQAHAFVWPAFGNQLSACAWPWYLRACACSAANPRLAEAPAWEGLLLLGKCGARRM
jgi:hypothetical protein